MNCEFMFELFFYNDIYINIEIKNKFSLNKKELLNEKNNYNIISIKQCFRNG